MNYSLFVSRPGAVLRNRVAQARLPLTSSEIKGYRRLGEALAQIIHAQLPGGGIVKLDGVPGVGKSMLVDEFLAPSLGALKRRMVDLDLDGFLRPKDERRAMARTLVAVGQSVTDEFRRIYDTQKAMDVLNPILAFVGSPGPPHTVKQLAIPGDFEHGKAAGPLAAHSFRRTDIVILNAEYIHDFSLRDEATPTISVRLDRPPEQALAQWNNRTRAVYAQDPNYLAVRERYHLLVTMPSFDRYRARTASKVRIYVQLPGDPKDWCLAESPL